MTRIAPATAFADAKPFPGTEGMAENPRAVLGGNAPPPEEAIVIEFKEALAARPGFTDKVKDIVTKAGTLPDCKDDDTAGKLGDFVKIAKAAIDFVNDEHSKVKRPYLLATRAIDSERNGIVEDLEGARSKAKAKLDAYVAEQTRLAREEQKRIADELAERDRIRREREAEARKAVEEALAKNQPAPVFVPEPEPEPEPEPVRAATPAAPVARGDLGSRVGTRTVWKSKIDSVRKLPDAILNHPSVVEALEKIVAARVRGGEREIKGCTIWSDQEASVR